MDHPRIYLDSANGRPLFPSVVKAMAQGLSTLGNPSSLHAEGRAASAAKEAARGRVASLLGCRSQELLLTSSGTEANASALLGLARAHEAKGRHLILSAVEHLSILQLARRMEKQGWELTLLPVDAYGRVDPQVLEEAIRPQTVLLSIQWANAEVGTVQPMEELVHRVKTKGILFHTDCVAAVGQIPIDLKRIPVDALSMAANTFGGPPGVGALFVRKGVRMEPLFVGGAQEEGRRAGTENLLGIIGMGEAASCAAQELPTLAKRLAPLRDRLSQGILKEAPEAGINGHPIERLPGHVSVSFPGADGEALVLGLDLEGISVGIGSACTASTRKASHVLKAMGVEESRALGTIVLSLCLQTKQEEVDRFLEVLPKVLLHQQGAVVTR